MHRPWVDLLNLNRRLSLSRELLRAHHTCRPFQFRGFLQFQDSPLRHLDTQRPHSMPTHPQPPLPVLLDSSLEPQLAPWLPTRCKNHHSPVPHNLLLRSNHCHQVWRHRIPHLLPDRPCPQLQPLRQLRQLQ